jgi:hypothetical protein
VDAGPALGGLARHQHRRARGWVAETWAPVPLHRLLTPPPPRPVCCRRCCLTTRVLSGHVVSTLMLPLDSALQFFVGDSEATGVVDVVLARSRWSVGLLPTLSNLLDVKKLLSELRFLSASTSTVKTAQTGRWSNSGDSQRPYGVCLSPGPRHRMRSHHINAHRLLQTPWPPAAVAQP